MTPERREMQHDLLSMAWTEFAWSRHDGVAQADLSVEDKRLFAERASAIALLVIARVLLEREP